MIYTGEKASQILRQNLENRESHICSGYFFEGNAWIAFDNYTEDCWVEEFKTEEMAICWIEDFFEMSEIEDFNVLKIGNDLLYIPNEGHLQYFSNDNIYSSKFHPLSALGIEAKSPQRGTSEDLQRIARPFRGTPKT